MKWAKGEKRALAVAMLSSAAVSVAAGWLAGAVFGAVVSVFGGMYFGAAAGREHWRRWLIAQAARIPGRWEAVKVCGAWRVRWSLPERRADERIFLYVKSFAGSPWGQTAAERAALEFNAAGRQPEEFDASIDVPLFVEVQS